MEFSSWDLPTVDGSEPALNGNGQFKVPSNASYVQFEVTADYNSSQVGSPDNVMLLYVGDTYNPDFVVPEYQPYGQKSEAIKEELMPVNYTDALRDIDTLKNDVEDITNIIGNKVDISAGKNLVNPNKVILNAAIPVNT